jgi:hypothetical protein
MSLSDLDDSPKIKNKDVEKKKKMEESSDSDGVDKKEGEEDDFFPKKLKKLKVISIFENGSSR